jgi:hypothetical protein
MDHFYQTFLPVCLNGWENYGQNNSNVTTNTRDRSSTFWPLCPIKLNRIAGPCFYHTFPSLRREQKEDDNTFNTRVKVFGEAIEHHGLRLVSSDQYRQAPDEVKLKALKLLSSRVNIYRYNARHANSDEICKTAH